MFYKQEEISENLICQRCKRIFTDPRIIVPCVETICIHCVEDLTCENEKEIMCFFCETKHQIPENGFKQNKHLAGILRTQAKTVYRGTSIEQLKSKLKQLDEITQKLEKIMQEFEVTVNDYCCSLRSRIDLSAEMRFEEIKKIRYHLLEQVNDYEKKCKQNVEECLPSFRNKMLEVQNFTQQSNEYLNGFEIDENQVKDKSDQTVDKFNTIDNLISEFNSLKFDHKKVEFNQNESQLLDNLLGHLEMKSEIFKGELTKTLSFHDAGVYSIVKLKEDIFCSATGVANKKIKIWNLKSEQVLTTLDGQSPLLSIGDDILCSGADDCDIKMWHWPSGKLLKTFKHQIVDGGRIRAIIQINNQTLASCYHRLISFWNLSTGQNLKSIVAHEGWILSLILISNGNLASCSEDKTIKIWNQNSGELIQTLSGHLDVVYCVVELKNQTLASGSSDKTIRIWNLSTGVTLKILKEHNGTINCLGVFKNGNLISGSTDTNIIIWDTDKGTSIETLKGHSKYVFGLLVLDDGKLLSTSEDRTIKIWE